MPITIRWDDELSRTILVKFPMRWTWEDYQLAIDEGISKFSNIEGRIDQLIDMTDTMMLPRGAASTHLSRGHQIDIPRDGGITVYAGNPNFIRQMLKMFMMNVSETSPNLVQTVEEARQRIQQHRTGS